MCSLPLADASVDAVICMWQSFGHFDDEGNQHVLHEMARVLTRSGRLILDLYHRDFHAARLGERILERDGLRVRESRAMRGPRLSARLQYEPGNSEDQFEWDLYTPEELAHRARPLGLELRLACAEFDEHTPASADHPRMQLVFQGSPKRQKASPVSASAIRRA
jgi:SAM-dependent methyltransferase